MGKNAAGIKLRQLHYFVEIAEQLHFTRAADRLAVTQPTLSHQIAQLELQLAAPLFDRLGSKVHLTEAGKLFLTFAKTAIKNLEAGCTALAELEGMVRGTIRIGVIQSFSQTFLPPILGDFASTYRGIRLHVEEMTATDIEVSLTAGKLDLGIAFAPCQFEETEVEPVLDEELVLAIGAQHPLAGRKTVRLIDLDRYPLGLLHTGFSTRLLIDRYLKEAGAHPRIVCETNSWGLMIGTVMHSHLATIVPEHAVRTHVGTQLRVIKLRDPTPVRTSALLWPRDSFRTVAARAFAEKVRSELLRRPKRPS